MACSLPPTFCKHCTSLSWDSAGMRCRWDPQVPLPRSTDALSWLRGQPCSLPQLMPRIYFSLRHSSAPDTQGGAAASAAAAGSGAVAGVGSAWTWQVCTVHRNFCM